MNEERSKKLQEFLKKKRDKKASELKDAIEQTVDREELRGDEGAPGQAGKDGATPSKEELEKIIKPLIPKQKEVKPPSKKYLKDLITPLIPDPQPGRDGKDGLTYSYKGEWKVSTKYKVNDTVSHDGSSFLCLKNHKSRNVNEPDIGTDWMQFWAVIARRGQDGQDGKNGGSGSPGVQSVVAGTNVTIDNSDPHNPVITATGGGGVDIGDAIGNSPVSDGILYVDSSGNLQNDLFTIGATSYFGGLIVGEALYSSNFSQPRFEFLDLSGVGQPNGMGFATNATTTMQTYWIDTDSLTAYGLMNINPSSPANSFFLLGFGSGGVSSVQTLLISGSSATIGVNTTINATLSMNSHQINDVTDPTNAQDAATKAYVDANSGGGQVDSVVSGTGVTVDATDPVNPIVNLSSSSITSLGLADSALQSGDNVSELTNDANYATTSDLSDYLPLTGGTLTGSIDLHNGFLSTRRATTSNSDSASVYFYTDTTLKYSMGIFRNDDDLRIWKAGSTTDIFRVDYTTEKVHFAGIIADGGTASQIAYLDSNKELKSLSTSTYPSLTELAYVKGVTSSIQDQLQNFGGGVLLSNSRAGTALSLFSPASGSASATAYSAGNMLMWGFSGLGIQNIEALQINVTATGLAAGEYVTICVYEALSNGGPGTLLWSENITVGTGTGDKTISGLSGRTRPTKGWLAVLNPSGNSGSVTLSRVLPNVSNDALVNASGVAYGHLKTGVASPPDLTSEVLTADHTGVPIVRARP